MACWWGAFSAKRALQVLIWPSGFSIPKAPAGKNLLLPRRKVVFNVRRYEPNTSADDDDV